MFVDLQAATVGSAMEVIEKERSHILAADAPSIGKRQPLGQDYLVQIRIQLQFLGQREGNDKRRGNLELLARTHDVGDLSWIIDAPVERESTVAQIKTRESISCETQDADVEGLQPLQGRSHIQDGFHA